jgi:hypothetical protein
MLKRNGEICEAVVPNFPGRLTATEKRAYSAGIAAIEGQLRDLEQAGRALAEVERQIPNWRAGLEPNGNGAVLDLSSKAEDQWHVVKTLVKTNRSELLFCSRGAGDGREFAVFEKFDPTSAYAQAQGNPELILTSNKASLLLQDYVESERRMLNLVKQDLTATVEELLSERFPNENNTRVVKAVAARCEGCIAGNAQTKQTQKADRGVKIRV